MGNNKKIKKKNLMKEVKKKKLNAKLKRHLAGPHALSHEVSALIYIYIYIYILIDWCEDNVTTHKMVAMTKLSPMEIWVFILNDSTAQNQ